MKVHNYIFYVLIFIVVGWSCKSEAYQVIHVTNNQTSEANGIFYYLPRTVIIADVTVKKTTYIPGPLYEYSDSYLGYTGISEKQEKYELAEIKLSTKSEPDPEQLYFIELKNKEKVLIEYDKAGIIRKVNELSSKEEINARETALQHEKKEKENREKNITLINLKEKLDTVYTRQIHEGGVIIENRQIERVLIKSSKQESAKDAVKMINDIRSQKYRLISYSDELAYPAATLEVMMKELNKLENEYLNLFLGTSEVQTLTYQFEFRPHPDKKGIQPFFKFSPIKGINDSLKLIMETVYIQQETAGITQEASRFVTNQQTAKKANKNTGIVYRIPETCLFKIILNNRVLTQQSFPVSQLGVLYALPAENLSGIKAQFDTNTGMLIHLGINQ